MIEGLRLRYCLFENPTYVRRKGLRNNEKPSSSAHFGLLGHLWNIYHFRNKSDVLRYPLRNRFELKKAF